MTCSLFLRCRSFAIIRAKLMNLRSAGLSLCGSHAALNCTRASLPATGRRSESKALAALDGMA